MRVWNDLPLRTKSLAVIAIPVIPLLVSSALFAQSARRAREAQDAVTHTLRVKAQIAVVLGAIVDAETGVRGFLLTHSDEALRVYENANAVLRPAAERLAMLIANDPVQIGHFETIRRLAATRPLTPLLDYAHAAGPGAPAPLALLAQSRATMAALRVRFAEMQDVEDRRLEASTAAAARAQQRQGRLVVAGAALGLIGGVLAAFVFSAGVASRMRLLGENATRLSRGEPLLALPAAGDEVGQAGQRLNEAHMLLTERLRQIRESRDELDQFFSLSLDMLCIVGPDGRFTRVNPSWHQTLGWSDAELCAVPYIEFVHPDDLVSTLAAGAQLAEGAAVINFENRYRCKDGTYRWLQWQAAPLPSGNGAYATAHNVTDKRHAAQELESRAAALAVANDELEAFSYSVSHDLRAPLRHITGFAALLSRGAGPQLDAQARRHLTTIEEAAARMGRLIDDLLSFSRMGRTALGKRRVDLAALVEDAWREAVKDAEDRPVTWSLGPLPEVEADPAMLRLALTNLLSNAVKYSSGRPEPRIEVGTAGRANGEITFFVRDNGVGFDMAYAHKLFGVFQRLHGAHEFEGTGIGLANVRRIIHRHGGRTWAEGAVGAGATFYFSLPDEERAA